VQSSSIRSRNVMVSSSLKDFAMRDWEIYCSSNRWGRNIFSIGF
jgi:hypothetical protein